MDTVVFLETSVHFYSYMLYNSLHMGSSDAKLELLTCDKTTESMCRIGPLELREHFAHSQHPARLKMLRTSVANARLLNTLEHRL